MAHRWTERTTTPAHALTGSSPHRRSPVIDHARAPHSTLPTTPADTCPLCPLEPSIHDPQLTLIEIVRGGVWARRSEGKRDRTPHKIVQSDNLRTRVH